MTSYWEARNEAYTYFHNNIRPIPHYTNSFGNFTPYDLADIHNNDVDSFRHAYKLVFFMEQGQ